MKNKNLFDAILENFNKSGYLTRDELSIMRDDPEMWDWLEKYLAEYERTSHVGMRFSCWNSILLPEE